MGHISSSPKQLNINITNLDDLVLRWYYTYGAYVGTTLAALSGWMIEKEIRANLRLGTLSFFTTKACVIVVPALMSYTTHELVVKRNILLGKEGCAICSMTQSGVVQTFSSVFYTYLASMLVCQPIAYKYRLQKFPELTVKPWERPSHYLNFIRKISPPTQLMLILTMANFTAGGLLARKDLQLFYRYLAQPPSAHEVQQEFENGTPV